MKSVLVFCGASAGNKEEYRIAADNLGRELGSRGLRLVYGGAHIGLMGRVADSALAAGGQVTGVIPNFMAAKEIAHTGVQELITVDSMHQRKHRMYELGDAVIAMPGGWGTMDELFEVLTWGQIGLHLKPVALLNINKYYDLLVQQCQRMADDGFLQQHLLDRLIVSYQPAEVLDRLAAAFVTNS